MRSALGICFVLFYECAPLAARAERKQGKCKYCPFELIIGLFVPQIQMFTEEDLLGILASPVTGEFPAQRPVMRSFDVFFDLRLNKQLSK